MYHAARQEPLKDGRSGKSINVTLSPSIVEQLETISCGGNRSAAIEKLVRDHIARARRRQPVAYLGARFVSIQFEDVAAAALADAHVTFAAMARGQAPGPRMVGRAQGKWRTGGLLECPISTPEQMDAWRGR